jgi:hypothetical protein
LRPARFGSSGSSSAIAFALREALADRSDESIGQARNLVGDRRHRHVELGGGAEQAALRDRIERMLSREQLPHDDAERPDVAAVIDLVHAELLGRHERQRAGDRCHATRSGIARHRLFLLRREQRRDAEVEHFDRALQRHDDVLGLEIAMHDVRGVRVRERLRDRHDELDHAAERHAAAGHHLRQLRALDVLEHHVRQAAEQLDLVDHDDVLVAASRGRARFDEKPLGQLRRARAEELHRDAPAEPRVAREIDLAHAAAAELADQLVMLDAQPRRELQLRRFVGRGRAGPFRVDHGAVERAHNPRYLANKPSSST